MLKNLNILRDILLYILLILAFLFSSVDNDVRFSEAGVKNKFVYQQF